MFEIKLKNNKKFICDKDSTIFEAAKKSNIVLDHSCLSSRCRSCVVKILSGKTVNKEEELVLTEEDKNQNLVLSCNAKPLSDLELDIADLGDIKLFEKKIIPSKISVIEMKKSVIPFFVVLNFCGEYTAISNKIRISIGPLENVKRQTKESSVTSQYLSLLFV